MFIALIIAETLCLLILVAYLGWRYWPRPKEYETRLLARIWTEDRLVPAWRRARAYLFMLQAKRIADYELSDGIPSFLREQAD